MIELALIGLLAFVSQLAAVVTTFGAGKNYAEHNDIVARKFIASAFGRHLVTFGLVALALSLGL